MHKNRPVLSIITGDSHHPDWRWRFSAHVIVYILATLLLTLLLPLSIHAMLLRSLLLLMLCLHFYWLSLPPVEPLRLETLPLPAADPPLLPAGRQQAEPDEAEQLWYRWHDI
jgi:hypothetical protein